MTRTCWMCGELTHAKLTLLRFLAICVKCNESMVPPDQQHDETEAEYDSGL